VGCAEMTDEMRAASSSLRRSQSLVCVKQCGWVRGGQAFLAINRLMKTLESKASPWSRQSLSIGLSSIEPRCPLPAEIGIQSIENGFLGHLKAQLPQ
jgi:hypothetical protein